METDLSRGLYVSGDRHPGTRHFSKLFAFGHLPPDLREVSSHFAGLAQYLVDTQQDGPELSACLRKLWEAKNSAVVNAGFLAGP